HKQNILRSLDADSSERFRERVRTILSDVTTKVGPREWGYFSKIFFDGHSPLRRWSQEGVEGDLARLLSIVKKDRFIFDLEFLNKTLAFGIDCENAANRKGFY